MGSDSPLLSDDQHKPATAADCPFCTAQQALSFWMPHTIWSWVGALGGPGLGYETRTLILILLFSFGDSKWYTTSKRCGRSGKSTAVMSMRHLNCVFVWSRKK